MIVSNICTDSFPSGRVKLPQIQHAARPPRLSHRKTVSYHRVIEYWCILKQLILGLDPSFVFFSRSDASIPTRQFRSSPLSCTGDSLGLFPCSCVRLPHSQQRIDSNAFSSDLYYLAFPKDRQFTKYLVYGIYIVEFAQTMLVTHDAFSMFGYGFGDIEALTDMHFNWLTVPIMSAAGTRGIFFWPASITYHEYSCLCRAGVLCIPNF